MRKRIITAASLLAIGLLTAGLLFLGRRGAIAGDTADTAMAADANTSAADAAMDGEGGMPLPDSRIGSNWKPAAGEAAGLGYAYLAMENARVEFYVNEDGNVGVFDKAGGKWYTSIPSKEARDADTIAKAINKANLGSDYQVVFVDQNGATTTKNTYAGAVNDGNVRITDEGSGLKVWYYFEDTGVMFSMLYQLTEDGFTVSVPFEDFYEHIAEGRTAADRGTVSYWGIRSISVLPYFGAAGLEDTGYLLIPDGSGALINFNNQKSSYGAYSQDIYGRDPVLVLEKSLKTAKNVLMPVFGASFGDHGFFAVAESGAASATINAVNSGTLTSYNNVYMTFRYRQTMSATRSVANSYGGNGTLGSTVVVENNYSESSYRLRYYLLTEESADYVGMAECYRNYLISQGMSKKESAKESCLYLNLYGGIEDTHYFLGIPYKAVTTLTTYKEAKEILEKLKGGGAEHMAVRYCGWQKDGLEASVPTKVKYESALGGEKDFQSLTKYAADAGIRLFPDLDFLNFYQSGSYSVHSDAIQAATHDTAYQYTYDLNSGNKQNDSRYQLLTPNLSLQAFQKLAKKNTLGTGISLGGVGSLLYSDFTARKNAIHRDDTISLWSEMVKEAAEKFGSVMVETGNIYAAMYADYISGVTTESTNFNLTDESVPFYQIVMHGYVSYASEPINLTADPKKALLKALETGSNLEFSLICGDAYELVDTRFNYLYNASYKSWEERILEYYKEAQPILSAVAENEITGHEKIGERAYRTDYGTAGSVYVNYGKKDIIVDGLTIAAGGFAFQSGERR